MLNECMMPNIPFGSNISHRLLFYFSCETILSFPTYRYAIFRSSKCQADNGSGGIEDMSAVQGTFRRNFTP
jgi:hypothetical protein